MTDCPACDPVLLEGEAVIECAAALPDFWAGFLCGVLFFHGRWKTSEGPFRNRECFSIWKNGVGVAVP